MVQKGEKRKVTYSTGGNGTEIDFVLMGKGNRKYLRNVKVIQASFSTGWWSWIWLRRR